MAEPDTDSVRLSVPAEEAMRPVIEVAVRVLARRWGVREPEVIAVRDAAGDALVELAREGGAAPVVVEVRTTGGRLEVQLTDGTTARTLLSPPP